MFTEFRATIESMEKVQSLTKTTNPFGFVREVVSELKKVTWPNRKDTIKMTALVIILSVLVGAFVGGLDALFVQLQSIFFRR